MIGEGRPEAAHAQRTTNASRPDGGLVRHAKLVRLNVAEMVSTPPAPVAWLVEGLVIRGGVTLVAGLAGRGKSLLAQALAMAATRTGGGSVAGIRVEPAKVLIVDAENGPREIHRRVHALRLAPDSAKRLDIVEADGFHLGRDLHELARVMEELAPDLVVLDGFRSLWPIGDENKSDEVTPVLARLRSLVRQQQVGALLIHHSPKSGQTYRGSSAIAASVELAFVLERVEGDDDAARRRLRCEKSRPAPEPPARWLRLASGDDLAQGVSAIEEAEPFNEPGRDSAPATTALCCELVGLIAARGPLKRAEMARLTGRSPSHGTLRRATEKAVEDGWLSRREDERYELASRDGNADGNGSSPLASLPDTYQPTATGNTTAEESHQ